MKTTIKTADNQFARLHAAPRSDCRSVFKKCLMNRYLCAVGVAAVCILTFGSVAAQAAAQAELGEALKKIDMELYQQSAADLRGFLDALIEKYWQPGEELQMDYDCGGLGGIGAMWFRGYEMLGEKKHLLAGLDFVDAILKTQRSDGMFPAKATLVRNGNCVATGSPTLQDEYNFVQFSLVCYAYKLTKDTKYLDAALKHAETLRSCQDPAKNAIWQGPWPHTYYGDVKPGHGEGYRTGYMLNDYVTWNGMRTMIMAYKLSGDKKYIDRLNLLPAYILNANVGLGNVRGWRGHTDPWNEHAWQRNFEGGLIDPRNLSRFACPMLTYFSAVMSNDTGLNMVREAFDWLRSMERPEGWAYAYTYDGREAYTGQYRDMLRTDYHIRTKVVLDCVDEVLNVAGTGGVEALRRWYGPCPIVYNDEQYLAARIASAQRATDENLTVRLSTLEEPRGLVTGRFLARVRERPLKSPNLGVSSGFVWMWWRSSPRPVPYRGWAAWQYVWDVRVALGKIDADTAAWGGRGLESAGAPTWFFPIWDTVGDWSTKAVEVENWLDIPLQPPFVQVKSVRLEPATMTLKPAEAREIKPVFTPESPTCQTGTWTVIYEDWRNDACWVQPQMLKEIDSTVVRPTYQRVGKITIQAGLPHRPPGKATVVFTSTDGKHQATCKVEVTN